MHYLPGRQALRSWGLPVGNADTEAPTKGRTLTLLPALQGVTLKSSPVTDIKNLCPITENYIPAI